MKALPSLHPVSRAMERARRACAAFPELSHASLPLPLFGEAGLVWAACLAPSEPAPKTGALRVGVPAYLISFRADFGTFAELRPIAPHELGLPGGAGAWLGEVTDMTPRASLRARLFELLEITAPSFASGTPRPAQEAKAAAAELRRLFPEAAEPPLLGCYRALGELFFAWVDRVAEERR